MTDDNKTPASLALTNNGQQPVEIQSVQLPLKLPHFWEEDPALWFMQVEMIFAANNITQQNKRFNLVSYKILSQVSGLIKNPGDNPYETLKERLITIFSQSQEKRLLTLLEETQLGDSKPSQLLRIMQNLAGDNAHNQVIKTVWMRALPQRVRAILAALTTDDIDQMATVADKIMETDDPSPSIAASTSASHEISKLICEIQDFKTEMSKLRSEVRNKDRSRSRSRSKTPQGRKPLCFYHARFKQRAHKCQSPCGWITPKTEEKKESEN